MTSVFAAWLNPNVSTTAERFAALEALRKAGIPTVVWMTPVLPFINDTQENLLGLLDCCVKAGVKGIVLFDFGEAFGLRYACQSPDSERLWAIFRQTCKQHGILYQPDAVFPYLRQFETKQKQISFFGE